jgi:nitroimidazol reductase NimA-like FMN-containing flavoprotein (pyridoxamine 5'-phosphate oxidase superfamily)
MPVPEAAASATMVPGRPQVDPPRTEPEQECTDVTEQDAYPKGSRTTPTRLRERAEYAAEAVHAVLDEGLICHVGVVVDGEPVVLPTIHARVGRALYLHGSTGSRLTRLATDGGVPVCVTVTLLDGLVLARSQFHHSMNYRSVVVRGRAELVTDPAEKSAALAAVVEQIVPGRAEGSRPGDARELAATAVLRVALEEATLKQRSGPPSDDEEDLALPYWAGVIPVALGFGPAQPAPDLADGVALPGHVAGYGR